jgi:hypothetical protein
MRTADAIVLPTGMQWILAWVLTGTVSIPYTYCTLSVRATAGLWKEVAGSMLAQGLPAGIMKTLSRESMDRETNRQPGL